MPAYIWSCLGCGAANAPGASVCAQCTCPACASTARITACRDAWRARGGTVLAGAGKLPEAGDNDVPKALWHVACRTLWLLLGSGFMAD